MLPIPSVKHMDKVRHMLYKISPCASIPVVRHTPLEYNNRLSAHFGANIYFKREDLQPVRSFKIRGAAALISSLSDVERAKGIVCASAGNHAQGVAQTCNVLGLTADIFVPESTPNQKISRIINFSNQDNFKLHRVGSNFDECLAASLAFSNQNDKAYIHPYNHLETIAGQGTIGAEIFEDCEGLEIEPDYIMGSIGGGGLMSGIGAYSRGQGREGRCHVIGVEPSSCPSMTMAFKNKGPIEVKCQDNFVDGATVPKVGDVTFDVCSQVIDSIKVVDVGSLCSTMLELYQDDGIIVEPAGALPVTALSQLPDINNKTVVCIISGGNNDISRYPDIVERSLRYKKLKHYYVVEFGQKPGALMKFVKDVLGPNDDITRFEYVKKTNRDFGSALIGVEVSEPDDAVMITARLRQNGFVYRKLGDLDEPQESPKSTDGIEEALLQYIV